MSPEFPKRKTELTENGNFRLLVAKKRNGIGKLPAIAVSANVPI
jgi:hypothetical protein